MNTKEYLEFNKRQQDLMPIEITYSNTTQKRVLEVRTYKIVETPHSPYTARSFVLKTNKAEKWTTTKTM